MAIVFIILFSYLQTIANIIYLLFLSIIFAGGFLIISYLLFFGATGIFNYYYLSWMNFNMMVTFYN